MYCTECGSLLPEEAQFCPDCGTESYQIEAYQEQPELSDQSSVAHKQERTTIDDIPKEKERIDNRKPPKISLLTLFFALLGLLFILVLLNPWHAGQEKPEDFQGTRNGTQQIYSPGDTFR